MSVSIVDRLDDGAAILECDKAYRRDANLMREAAKEIRRLEVKISKLKAATGDLVAAARAAMYRADRERDTRYGGRRTGEAQADYDRIKLACERIENQHLDEVRT